jgi:nucleoside-diphosphate-sugar epimerase
LELIYKILNLSKEPHVTRFLAQTVSQDNWFDISAAKKDLGYSPQVKTAEGLKRLQHWLRSSQGQAVKE